MSKELEIVIKQYATSIISVKDKHRKAASQIIQASTLKIIARKNRIYGNRISQ